MIMKFKQEHK